MREQLHRGGFSEVDGGGADAGGRGCAGAIAGVPGGLLAGRGHQLELRRARAALEWVVIRTECLQQAQVDRRRVGEGDAVDLLRPRELPDLPQRPGEGGPIELVDEGRHGLAALRRVPLFRDASVATGCG